MYVVARNMKDWSKEVVNPTDYCILIAQLWRPIVRKKNIYTYVGLNISAIFSGNIVKSFVCDHWKSRVKFEHLEIWQINYCIILN